MAKAIVLWLMPHHAMQAIVPWLTPCHAMQRHTELTPRTHLVLSLSARPRTKSLDPASLIAVTVSSGDPGLAVVEFAVAEAPETPLVEKPSNRESQIVG